MAIDLPVDITFRYRVSVCYSNALKPARASASMTKPPDSADSGIPVPPDRSEFFSHLPYRLTVRFSLFCSSLQLPNNTVDDINAVSLCLKAPGNPRLRTFSGTDRRRSIPAKAQHPSVSRRAFFPSRCLPFVVLESDLNNLRIDAALDGGVPPTPVSLAFALAENLVEILPLQ